MKKNTGGIDRGLRIFAAVVIAVLYYIGILSGTLAIVLLVLAGIFVLTSFISFCPLYYPFNFSTEKAKRKP